MSLRFNIPFESRNGTRLCSMRSGLFFILYYLYFRLAVASRRSKPEYTFLAIEKERQEMEFPIIIITRNRWRETEARARRAQAVADGLSHSVDDLRSRLSAMAGILDGLRRDVRSLRRMLNEKDKKTWRFTGK